MNSAHTYTHADILRWFGSTEVRKGSGYLRDVSRLNIAPRQISADVLGTAPRPYHVEISFDTPRGGELTVRANCTCPVGSGCKHAAAALLVALDRRSAVSRANPEVLSWAERLLSGVAMPGGRAGKARRQTHALIYIIEFSGYSLRWQVALAKCPIAADGSHGRRSEPWASVERALLQPPTFVDDVDVEILRLLWAQRGKDWSGGGLPLVGRNSSEVLHRIADSGKSYLRDNGVAIPIAAGPQRRAELTWQLGSDGVRPRFAGAAGGAGSIDIVLPADPPWYVDLGERRFGPLDAGLPEGIAPALLELPPLAPTDLPIVAATLARVAPGAPPPAPDLCDRLRVIDCEPVPILDVDTLTVFAISRHRDYTSDCGHLQFDVARAYFRYQDAIVAAGDKQEFVPLDGGDTVRVVRRPASEKAHLEDLRRLGFETVPTSVLHDHARRRTSPTLGLASEAAWASFCKVLLPQLKTLGWEVLLPADFRHRVLEADAWYADIDDSDWREGWFELDLGIEVEGRRLALAPLLSVLFRSDPRWLAPGGLAGIADGEPVELFGPEGERIRVRAERIKPLARTLIDLFEDLPDNGRLRLPRLDAPRLVAATAGFLLTGEARARELAERLAGSEMPQAIVEPASFVGTLRPYQREGLGWLDYLRRHDLAGILADDMGLGKTAQALAHLVREKEAGRLGPGAGGPALVVLPTSLVFNWQREAQRFVPTLSVLALHGADRKERFDSIATHDVVLTTYPLIWRDEKQLTEHRYSLLILDEAQTVKNAASRAADVVRRIDARHRLCITGTPLENHLGELWSQFDFLVPGLLGDKRSFARLWRTPIEKYGDANRRDLLARRVRPFILRRRKEDVARDLPEKTVIIRSVELTGSQRDLYETVRSSMDARLREEIASRGFARSHIVILDALLKLRQVCCDPRLLKIDAAAKVSEHAKLDLLLDMLPELVDEGRRVLVFSQFTSMLALVEAELKRIKLPYVRLCGDTTDRATPVRRFQDGEVPVFLISLKAGGVGLNLTAADTVIHFDPWWNPAAENQATDRAHRIGQDKHVFVYKLIVAGSIEEKILALQASKAELAAGILGEDGAGIAKFGETDLAALLEPLALDAERPQRA